MRFRLSCVLFLLAIGVSACGISIKSSDSAATATIAKLTNGVTYYFTVTAVNASGESAGSAQVSSAPRLGSWKTVGTMPVRRYGHSTAEVNGIIYVFGGQTNLGWPGTEAYNPTANTWTTKTAMPTVRRNIATAVVNGIIYAIGGEEVRVIVNNTLTNRTLNTVEAYDPITNTWTTKASMPTARSLFSAQAVNGIIYAIAGYAGTTMSKVEAYNPATNTWTWTAKASMPTARGFYSAAELNGIIYIISGNNSSNLREATVEACDPETNNWVSKPPIPTPRYGSSASVVNGAIYVFGGYPPNSAPLTPIVEVYR